ncbi:ranaspumin-like [Engystomops pustulosus]|uniref:ranaspumin-like n=1 Tax=Engystomops pustulosus TaxID=76066 RepID=UPI003AFA72C1
MKIAVVLLVIAVSSCSGQLSGAGSVDDVPGLPGDVNIPDALNLCLIKTLKESSILLLRLAILICTYDQGKSQLNDDNWKSLYNSLEEVLKDTPCAISTILGDVDNLEALGKSTAEIVEFLVETFRPVLDSTGVSKLVMDTSCKLTEKLLKPDCFPLLLGGDVPQLLIDLKTQACKGSNKEVVIKDIIGILTRASCVLDGSVDLDIDAIANGITKAEDGSLIFGPNGTLLGDIIINVLCVAVEILLPLPLPETPAV